MLIFFRDSTSNACDRALVTDYSPYYAADYYKIEFAIPSKTQRSFAAIKCLHCTGDHLPRVSHRPEWLLQ